jgi:hypothetical protein
MPTLIQTVREKVPLIQTVRGKMGENGRRPPRGDRVPSPKPPRALGPPTQREPWGKPLTGKIDKI